MHDLGCHRVDHATQAAHPCRQGQRAPLRQHHVAHAVRLQQGRKAAGLGGQRYLMAGLRLRHREIDHDVDDAVADVARMIGQMQNPHVSPSRLAGAGCRASRCQMDPATSRNVAEL